MCNRRNGSLGRAGAVGCAGTGRCDGIEAVPGPGGCCGIGGVRYRGGPGLGGSSVLGRLGPDGAPGFGGPVPGEPRTGGKAPSRGYPALTAARRWPPVLVPCAAPRCMDWYMMNCELLATCSALGYLEGDVYHREPDCLGRWAPGGGGGGRGWRGLTAPCRQRASRT